MTSMCMSIKMDLVVLKVTQERLHVDISCVFKKRTGRRIERGISNPVPAGF